MEWHKNGKILPERWDDVLVIFNKAENGFISSLIMGIGYYNKYDAKWILKSEDGINFCITHWATLPDFPDILKEA